MSAGNEANQIQLSIRCKDGPIEQRRWTDLLCSAIVFMLVFANGAAKMTPSEIQEKLAKKDQSNPLLAIGDATVNILISISTAIVFSFILVVISFIIPSASAYIMIPLILLSMLLLGAGFLYRYFGNKLPFVNKQIQITYAQSNNVISLVIGIGFLAGFVISLIVILLKQQRIKFIVASLRLAKICFWQNFYMIFVSIILSGVSLGLLYINILFLQMSEILKQQSVYIPKRVISMVIIFQMLWTHGVMQSYSDFLFESFAVHWYFNQHKHRHQNGNYSKIKQNLLPSLKLSFIHYGTINFGWILAYIPQSLNVLMSQLQQKAEGLYKVCCCCHHVICENLSKYCYIGTIMYSDNFCQSSKKMKDIRQTAKHTFPELYMIGNFYITLMKIFIIFTSMIICYFLVSQTSDAYLNTLNLVGPLVVTLLGSLEIANHFMNATGLVGDTIYFAYIIDYINESSYFGNLNAEHCPKQAYEIIREAKIGKYAAYD